MARPGITYDQVSAAADAIIGDGLQPTISAVREKTGGSPTTVHKHLTAWKTTRPQAMASAPELPASLLLQLATELEKSAAQARAEIEHKLVQAQADAAELAAAGEQIEVERDDLLEQITALTTDRDTIAGKADQKEQDIKILVERVEREQNAAENARIELAKSQLKIDGNAEKLIDQAKIIEKLNTNLEAETKARIAAEQAAAVLTVRLEAMTDRAIRAETLLERKN